MEKISEEERNNRIFIVTSLIREKERELKELEEEWGVRVSKYEIGKGYFGKDGERE